MTGEPARRPLFSVLLPTRDRLEYLRQAIESVVQQTEPDFELVVSDNHSSADVRGLVSSFNDIRLRYVRTGAALDVTDSWNFAAEASRGRYLVMLGDDDALLPRHLARMRELLRDFEEPELIYTSSWLFTYPGVEPWSPGGYLAPNGYAPFLGKRGAHLLEKRAAARLVRDFMNFRLAYSFNMQFAVFSRGLVDRLTEDGPLFRSTFPDYYALNAMMLEAKTIVADPEALVVIGVTPKSHGFYYVNARADEGIEMLNPAGDAPTDPAELPGSTINTGWLSAGRQLEARFGTSHGLRLNTSRYRYLQAHAVHDAVWSQGSRPVQDIDALHAALTPAERRRYAWMGMAALIPRLKPRLLRGAVRRGWSLLPRQFPRFSPGRVEGRYADISEVVADIG